MTHQRFLNIAGVVNFRDLGGYQTDDGRCVSWGKLFRAGQLDRIEADGVRALQDLRIQTVVDLRFSEETERYPTMSEAFPNATIIRWQDYIDQAPEAERIKLGWRDALETGDPQQVREAMRVNYPQKLYSHRRVYQAMMEAAMHQNVPVVFHCAAGKDRTGVGAALLLGLLGVPLATIRDDYLLSQHEMLRLLDTFRAGGAAGQESYQDLQQKLATYPQEVIAPVFDADPDYLETALDYLFTTYGSFGNYAKVHLNFDQSKVDRLRDVLLEPAASGT